MYLWPFESSRSRFLMVQYSKIWYEQFISKARQRGRKGICIPSLGVLQAGCVVCVKQVSCNRKWRVMVQRFNLGRFGLLGGIWCFFFQVPSQHPQVYVLLHEQHTSLGRIWLVWVIHVSTRCWMRQSQIKTHLCAATGPPSCCLGQLQQWHRQIGSLCMTRYDPVSLSSVAEVSLVGHAKQAGGRGSQTCAHTWRISSQLGQPCFLKSPGSWITEQRRHARRFFERACGGMAACIVVIVVVVSG